MFYAGAVDRPGTNSEFHRVDERIVGRMPKSLSFTQAAALPLTALTAWELLFDRLGVPYGNKTQQGTLLVIAGAGGGRVDPDPARAPADRADRGGDRIPAGDRGLVRDDGRPTT